MRGFQLQLRMMLRRLGSNTLVVLLLIVTTLFLLMYPRVIDSAAEKMVDAGKGIAVNGWFYCSDSSKAPTVPLELRDGLLATGYIESYIGRSQVQYYALDEIIEKQGVGDTPEERRDYVLSMLERAGFSITATKGNLRAVNHMGGDDDLLAMQERIAWLEGYDGDCLAGTEQVCLYPAGMGVELGEKVELLLYQPIEGTKYDRDRLLVSFKVVGHINGNPTSPVVYCPLAAAEGLLRDREGFDQVLDRCFFTVGEKDKLSALKDFFVENDLHESRSLLVALDDRMYDRAMAPLEKNLNLLRGLQYIFYILVILLGFFLCFLVARRRKPEYGVMRMLGESWRQVVLKALLEQLILCVMGVGLGLGCLLLAGQRIVQPAICLVIILSYCLGAALAVGLTLRVDVMTVLREKE